jgi:radical SAM superfamily enzyme YgiQ (UPF0313 family)
MHATLIPGEVAEHADAVSPATPRRSGRRWWLTPPGTAAPALRRAWGAAAGGRARPVRRQGIPPISLLQFGRGCRFHCEYCAVGEYFAHHQYTRPVAEVMAEIAAQPRRELFFVDDNLVANPEAAKELLRALIPLKVRWVSQASLDHTRDPELMRLFVESGCLGNVIGFESLDVENLRQMRKSANLAAFDRYAGAVATLREHHLQTWAAFALGYDHDTVNSVLETCEWGIANHFTFAAFNVLMPYPSTPLYQRLQAEGRLLYDGRWWLHPDYRFNSAAFRPARMTADELTETAWACRQRWSSPASIARRVLDLHTNLATPFRFALYLVYNPLFRREAFKRQGMRLGTR